MLNIDQAFKRIGQFRLYDPITHLRQAPPWLEYLAVGFPNWTRGELFHYLVLYHGGEWETFFSQFQCGSNYLF